MRVRDIMTKKVVTVESNASIIEVARLLVGRRFHGVPVVENGKVIGIITETDFFTKDPPNIYLPGLIDFIKIGKLNRFKIKNNKAINSILEATAKDIMTPYCITVLPDLEIEELIRLLKKKKLTTVPVVDGNNELSGIVTTADLIKLL